MAVGAALALTVSLFATAAGASSTPSSTGDRATPASEPTADVAVADLDIAMVITRTSVRRAPWQDYFQSLDIDVDFYTVAQLGNLVEQVSSYDVVLYGFNVVDRPTQTEFDTFLSATDSAGVGVVFLDGGTSGGMAMLSEFTGSPETTSYTNRGVYPGWNFYQVVQDHPILEGFDVGQLTQQKANDSGGNPFRYWFDGYEGEGREVIAHTGRAPSEGGGGFAIDGSAIGVQERDNNRHVVLVQNARPPSRSGAWSAESDQIFWNALGWRRPASGDRSWPGVAGVSRKQDRSPMGRCRLTANLVGVRPEGPASHSASSTSRPRVAGYGPTAAPTATLASTSPRCPAA